MDAAGAGRSERTESKYAPPAKLRSLNDEKVWRQINEIRVGDILFRLDPAIYAFNARFYEHIRPGVCCPVLFGGVPFVNRGHERDRVHFACGR